MITPLAAIKTGFRHYITFRGRATRPEFWYWMLFVALAALALTVGAVRIGSATNSATAAGYLLLLPTAFILATLLPTLAITARRLHDIGKSGWWQLAWYTAGPLLWVLPLVLLYLIVGLAFAAAGREIPTGTDWVWISMLVLLCSAAAAAIAAPALTVRAAIRLAQPGNPGANRYGPDPNDTSTKGRLYQRWMIKPPPPNR